MRVVMAHEQYSSAGSRHATTHSESTRSKGCIHVPGAYSNAECVCMSSSRAIEDVFCDECQSRFIRLWNSYGSIETN